VKIDNKYLQRLGVLPYEEDTHTRARTRPFAPDFGIETRRVEAQPRMLRGQWTAELAEDIMHVHGIDAEQHLRDIMVGGMTEQEGALGEANRALDELVGQAQENGEYDDTVVLEPVDEEQTNSMRAVLAQWMELVRRNS